MAPALGLPVAYRTRLLRRLGGLRPGVRPLAVALHDLDLRASELILPTCFIHVPAVLCHREQRAAALAQTSGPVGVVGTVAP